MHFSADIIRVFNLKMRQMEHVTCVGQVRNVNRILIGKSELVRMWTRLIWLKIGTNG
jgi:hypothetical protein